MPMMHNLSGCPFALPCQFRFPNGSLLPLPIYLRRLYCHLPIWQLVAKAIWRVSPNERDPYRDDKCLIVQMCEKNWHSVTFWQVIRLMETRMKRTTSDVYPWCAKNMHPFAAVVRFGMRCFITEIIERWNFLNNSPSFELFWWFS